MYVLQNTLKGMGQCLGPSLDVDIFELGSCAGGRLSIFGYHLQFTGDSDGSFYLYQMFKGDTGKTRMYVGPNVKTGLVSNSLVSHNDQPITGNNAYKMIYLPCGIIATPDLKYYLSYGNIEGYGGDGTLTMTMPSGAFTDTGAFWRFVPCDQLESACDESM
jgi:hypothetical protein